ncbi:hypothetical protein [Sphingomonas elodea]|uniref:hypothetical protein n=1 Tax=Sphingomonas elodea TaxID=179878 RepID=UPI0002630702|nr:hypothetical protein [Sphingomonas elodea]
MENERSCCCAALDDLAIVGMGHSEDLDARILATLDTVKDHGGEQWWLHAATCNQCGQHWMIAQESRIHDNYCLRRLSGDEMHAILALSQWPEDFLRFEQVLRLEREAGQVACFLDPRSPALVDTAHDLRRARPEISVADIAYALAISTGQAERLFRPRRWFSWRREDGGGRG